MTTKANIKNEKVKEEFYDYLGNVKERDPKTVQAYANAICEFEKFTGFLDFKTFTKKQAINFKEHLATHKNQRTGEVISKSYLRYATHVQRFFEWLKEQNGYKKHIKFNEIQFFNITKNDRKRANSTGFQESYEVHELVETHAKMPARTPLEKRDKAMFGTNILATPRISALQTLRIGSVKYYKIKMYGRYFKTQNLLKPKPQIP